MTTNNNEQNNREIRITVDDLLRAVYAVEYSKKEQPTNPINEEELKKIAEALTLDFPEMEQKEQLGIPDSDYNYHILSEGQDRFAEMMKTENYLCDLQQNYPEIIKPESKIEFINYGDTELVYVISSNEDKQTLLVGQPSTELGTVKLEYDNLLYLAKKHPKLVVAPTAYIASYGREGYLTPYIYQARCIASYDQSYGAYIPEPYYRFEPYNQEDEYLISQAIIANLIRLYDADKKLALAACKIGGGDFIMEKDYDNEPHTIETTLDRMHLIAARKLINIELKDYIELIKKEFQQRTYYKTQQEKDPSILINVKNRVPMSEESINEGIKLGLKLRNK